MKRLILMAGLLAVAACAVQESPENEAKAKQDCQSSTPGVVNEECAQ